MQLARRIVIEAPADRVWSVIAHEFAQVADWASGVSYSTPIPAAGENLVGSGRVCQTAVGELTERLISYDERAMRLSYRAEGLPSFVAEAINNWAVVADGPNRAIVEMQAHFRPRGVVGLIMGPLLKLQLGKLLREGVEELKHYVETGQPHPRKLRARAKTPRQASVR